jgi:hypothetical protein
MCHRLKFQNCKILQIGRLKTHPKAELRRRDIAVSKRKARKTAIFPDLRAENPPLAPSRGFLSAAGRSISIPSDEEKKASSITQAKFEIN